MRTTWIILLCTILAGGGMYYFATRKGPILPYDTLSLGKTDDSIKNKVRLYVAFDPSEVYYHDSAWWLQDSIPMREIKLDSARNAFPKDYKTATFYLSYDYHHFYDVEIKKPDSSLAFDISFNIQMVHDTLAVLGTIDDKKNDITRFSGPMLPLYSQFVLSYNNKLPPVPKDSITSMMQSPDKTITVVKQ